MDVFGIGFIVMMCILGGIIAVVADNLGRTLGKKRLSVKSRFLKLRPRRTAQVFTFGAGVLIPLLTLVAVMTLSADVRRWFAEGRTAIVDRDRLLGEVASLEQRAEGLDSEIARKAREVDDKNTQLIERNKKLQESQARLAESLRQVSTLTSQAKQASRNLASLTSRVKSLTADYRALQTKLAGADRELTAKQKAVDKLQISYNQLSVQITERDEYAYRLQNEIEELEGKIKSSLGEIDRLKKERDVQQRESDAQKAQFDRELAAKQRELELTALELDKRRGELQRADLQLQQVGALALASRRFPMVYRLGEEIARLQVPANLSRNAAIDHITRLVRSSRTEAESKGAKGRGTFPSAGIMDRLDPENDVIISADAQLERIVNRITGLSEELVLIATSSVNSFLGEPVSLDIQSFRNPVVFSAGEMVAEGRIDGERPEEFIVEEIMEFVRNDVRKRAQEEGMVPVLGMERGYGEMDQNTLIALMRSARANNRRVRLQAFAPKNIRAGDPLVLDYRIR